jgi:predicted GTPase
MTDTNQNPEQSEPTGYEKQKAEEFAKHLKEAYTREFVFLLIGRTGVGKSSTINKLMGCDVAPVGDFEPQTMSVEEYKLPVSNVNFLVIDTPGLCDDLPEIGNDINYIAKIKQKVKHIDNILYVTPLSDTRIRSDEIRGIETITKAFGGKIWENSVIVFTFADAIVPDKYQYTFIERSRLMKQTIQKFVDASIVSKIPTVAVTNRSEKLPNGNEWLGELYTTVVERVSQDGFVQFLMATAPDLVNKEEKIVYIEKPIYVDRTVYITTPQTRGSYANNATTNSSTSGIKLDKKQRERIQNNTRERGFTQKVADAGKKIYEGAKEVAQAVQEGVKNAWNKLISLF